MRTLQRACEAANASICARNLGRVRTVENVGVRRRSHESAHVAVAAHVARRADYRALYRRGVFWSGFRLAEQALVVRCFIVDVQVVDRVAPTVEVGRFLIDGYPIKHVGVLIGRCGARRILAAAVRLTQQVDVGAKLCIRRRIGKGFCGTGRVYLRRRGNKSRVVHAGSCRVVDGEQALGVHLVSEPCQRLGGGYDVGVFLGAGAGERLEAGCARHVSGAQRGFVLQGADACPRIGFAGVHFEIARTNSNGVGAGYCGATRGSQVVNRVAGRQRHFRVLVRIGVRGSGQRRG